jgi:hypothetical protein
MSRVIAPRTAAILRALMDGVSRELVRGRFGLSGNQLADITQRHRALLQARGPLPVEFRLRLTETPAPKLNGRRGPAGAHGVPPLPLVGRRLFSKHTAWEEFERWRVDLGARQLLVPGGALFSNGDRAWRCEVSP